MKKLNEYLIPFIGLKLGKHQFEYQVDNTFFANFDYDEFESSNIKVNVVLEKKSTLMELAFKHKGTIHVSCDLTNEMFDLPIKANINLIVNFGEEFNDDNDEFIILPHDEFQVNVAQYCYEMMVLSVPTKRIHTGIKDGTLQSEALQNLEKFSPKETKAQEIKEIDPRWEGLKKLLTDKK